MCIKSCPNITLKTFSYLNYFILRMHFAPLLQLPLLIDGMQRFAVIYSFLLRSDRRRRMSWLRQEFIKAGVIGLGADRGSRGGNGDESDGGISSELWDEFKFSAKSFVCAKTNDEGQKRELTSHKMNESNAHNSLRSYEFTKTLSNIFY